LHEVKTRVGLRQRENIEIIWQAVVGGLIHSDSAQAISNIYIGAGTGIWHSEFNECQEMLKFLQKRISAGGQEYERNQGEFKFEFKMEAQVGQ
jgi:hypothetical protein